MVLAAVARRHRPLGGRVARFAESLRHVARDDLKSQILLLSGAAPQAAFICSRAQSAKFVNPPGTSASVAAM